MIGCNTRAAAAFLPFAFSAKGKCKIQNAKCKIASFCLTTNLRMFETDFKVNKKKERDPGFCFPFMPRCSQFSFPVLDFAFCIPT